MSKCDLRIELDRNTQVYKIGDRINCTVHVSVNKAVKCDGLVVSKCWYTHGRGNADSGTGAKQTLFKGEWQPGEYQYSCSFDIDSGPLTYHGHYVNIDWQLLVRADIPWAIDPKDSVEFVVERGQEHCQQLADEDLTEYRTMLAEKYRWMMFIVPLIFIAVGSGFAIFGWMDNDYFSMIFGAFFVLVASLVGYKMVQNSLAQRKLGKVDVSIEPSTLHPGEDATVAISFTPSSNINVNHITAKLVATETAVSGSGTNRTTHTYRLHNDDYPLCNKCQISRGMPVYRKLKISIPPDAPHTFIAPDNSIQWNLMLTIDIDNWPDWSNSKMIRILI